jgi:hypothetical protein
MREKGQPRLARHLSAALIVAVKTGNSIYSSRPVACHCAPYPVNTKPILRDSVSRAGIKFVLDKADTRSKEVIAGIATRHGRNDRRYPRVYARFLIRAF